MINAGILDGDYIIAKRTSYAEKRTNGHCNDRGRSNC